MRLLDLVDEENRDRLLQCLEQRRRRSVPGVAGRRPEQAGHLNRVGQLAAVEPEQRRPSTPSAASAAGSASMVLVFPTPEGPARRTEPGRAGWRFVSCATATLATRSSAASCPWTTLRELRRDRRGRQVPSLVRCDLSGRVLDLRLGSRGVLRTERIRYRARANRVLVCHARLGLVLRSRRRRRSGCDAERLRERSGPEAPQIVGRREDARSGLEPKPQAEVVRAARAGLDVDDDRSRRPDGERDGPGATVAARWVLRPVQRYAAVPRLLDELVEGRAGAVA